jgi:hypothetical protein
VDARRCFAAFGLDEFAATADAVPTVGIPAITIKGYDIFVRNTCSVKKNS